MAVKKPAMKKAAAKKTPPKMTSPKKPAGTPSDLKADFNRVVALAKATKLPALEEDVSYGTPSMKVAGKFLLRVREPGVLVLMCALEEKEFLMQHNPAIYYETDHYKGWPAVLVRMAKVKDDELKHRIEIAWRRQAPKKVLALVDGPKKKP